MSKLSEHPVNVILGLVGSLIAIFVFITGISNISKLFGSNDSNKKTISPTKSEQTTNITSQKFNSTVIKVIDSGLWNGKEYYNSFFHLYVNPPSYATVNHFSSTLGRDSSSFLFTYRYLDSLTNVDYTASIVSFPMIEGLRGKDSNELIDMCIKSLLKYYKISNVKALETTPISGKYFAGKSAFAYYRQNASDSIHVAFYATIIRDYSFQITVYEKYTNPFEEALLEPFGSPILSQIHFK